MNDIVFCVVGETCSGKDTVVKNFVENHGDRFSIVCSHAERPKRDYETDGVEHFFDTKESFDLLMSTHQSSDFLGYTEMIKDGKGYRYACLKEDIKEGTIPFYIVDPNGIEYMERVQEGKMKIITIYIYSPFEVRYNRFIINRNPEEDPEKTNAFTRRIDEEREEFEEFRNKGLYDYMIINDNCINQTELNSLFAKFVFTALSSVLD